MLELIIIVDEGRLVANLSISTEFRSEFGQLISQMMPLIGQFLKIIGTQGNLNELATEELKFVIKPLRDYKAIYIFSQNIDPYEVGLMQKLQRLLDLELQKGTLESNQKEIEKRIREEYKLLFQSDK